MERPIIRIFGRVTSVKSTRILHLKDFEDCEWQEGG